MNVIDVVCLPDLLRSTRQFPEAFFDFIREPLLQGTGLRLTQPADTSNNKAKGLKDFRLNLFKTYACVDRSDPTLHWAQRYHTMPQKALDYLAGTLPDDCLIISFDMPPWMQQMCEFIQVPYIDLRTSPLRFGRDLYVAMRASHPALHDRLKSHAVLEEELRMEASLLGANIRMHQRGLLENGRYRFEGLDDTLVVLGHRPHSPRLIDAHGAFLAFEHFAEPLSTLTAGKRVIYKPHPAFEAQATNDRHQLEQLIGKPVHRCLQNIYQILASQDSVELAGIASGALQEAVWFEKKAHHLHKPFVPLEIDAPSVSDGYHQVHFETLLAPGFWHQLLTPARQQPRMARLPAIAHHFARESTDSWTDYGKVITWERSLPHQSFERLGGGLLRQRIESLEARGGSAPQVPQIPTAVPISPDTLRWENLDVRQLLEHDDSSDAAALFKHSVRMIEIEIFSFCNRKCWFCPNSTVDRISKNTLMPPEMYSSIIRQLASIDYTGMITYSRYNEPLADKVILERLREASELLPNAILHTNTNGDYLDTDYVEQLYEAGLRSLNIQIYLGNNERYDHDKIKVAGDKLLRRVRLPATLVVDEPGQAYEFRLHYRDMAIRLYGRNFETSGTSRGGQVPIHLQHVRTSPCLVPFYAVYIDHDGSSVPCCNFRSDVVEHADYVIGNLKQQPNLFLQYAGRIASRFRRSLLNDQVKGGLCANCHYAEELPTPAQYEQMDELNDRLEQLR